MPTFIFTSKVKVMKNAAFDFVGENYKFRLINKLFILLRKQFNKPNRSCLRYQFLSERMRVAKD